MTPFEHARLAVLLMPVRVLGWGIGLIAFLVFAASVLGCGAVQVTAEREGRCTIKRAAPFAVLCWSDGKPVLEWRGPVLTVEEVHE